MIKSGITAVDAIDSLAQETKSDAFRKVLMSIVTTLKNGQTIANALKKHASVFDQFYISLIHVGEESGTLEKNLAYLASQMSKDYNLRKKIQGVMLYPTIVLIASVGVGAFIAYFILPQLIDFFTSLDVELPFTTKVLLFVATTMKQYGIFIGAGCIAMIVAFRLLLRTKPIKKHWHHFLLSIPFLGDFLQNATLAALCRNFGIMLTSGLTITSALEILGQAEENLVFKEYLSRMLKSVTRGRPISQELNSSYYKFVPSLVTKMIAVGEKTGELDQSLVYLGEFFEEEVDNAARNLGSILEPILLVFLGVLIGFIALAIITPIYQLTGSIRRQ